MALPNITISPAGAGVVVPSSLFTYSGTPTAQIEKQFTEGADELHFYLVPNNTYDVNFYKLTATAANGYIFDHFEFETRESWQSGSDTYNLSNGNNPAISNGRPVGAQPYAGIGDFYISGSGEWSRLETLSITAVFRQDAPTTYTISTSVSPAGSGTTTGDGSYNLGSTATITATPNNLFRFLRWELNGATVSTSSTYSFSVTGNATYTAVFEAVPSAIIEVQTYSEKAAGYVAPDAIVSINGQSDNDNDFSLVVARGSTVTVGATAYGGLEDPQLWPVPMYFVGWLKYPDYNTILSDSLQYTFTTSQADYSLRYLAKYVTHYTLNTSVRPAASAGTVALSPLSRYGNNLYPEYSNVTLTAAPNPGWKFKHWIKKDRWSEVVVSSATAYAVEITEDLYYDTVYIAVFEWDGTDLLVNSSNLGSPVKLVYDDTPGGTGKLIADY